MHGRPTHPFNTHPFNGPFSGTIQVSRYQKGKTNLDFTEERDSEWQWHQLGHMQVCTSLQTDNHASTPPLSFFTGRMPFLPPNQQRQSTEGTTTRPTVVQKSRQTTTRSSLLPQTYRATVHVSRNCCTTVGTIFCNKSTTNSRLVELEHYG